MKPKLFLHVGVAKTGSTALQTFFANNFGLLEEKGILYPNVDGNPVNRQPWVGNAMTIGDSLWKNTYDPDVLRDIARSVKRRSETKRHVEAIFFSSEIFSQVTLENNIRDFCEAFSKHFSLVLIVVVRDPLNWYYSRWRQEIKSCPETRPFEEYLTCEPNQFPLVRKWLSYADEAHFLSYETHRKDLLMPFLELLNVPELLEQFPRDGAALSMDNRSLSDSELLFYQLFNQVPRLAEDPKLRWNIFGKFVFERDGQSLTYSKPDPGLAAAAEERHEDFFQALSPYISREDVIVSHAAATSSTGHPLPLLDPEEVQLAFSAIGEQLRSEITKKPGPVSPCNRGKTETNDNRTQKQTWSGVMNTFLKKIARMSPPIERLYTRAQAQEKIIAQLRVEACQLQSEQAALSKRLAAIDGDYYLSKMNSSAQLPVPGEYSSVYYVEILSGCNLHCALCAFGSKQIFQRSPGKMSLETFEQILDQIKQESPSAIVSPYHHCEPTLHPAFPQMLAAIKSRGFPCAVSVNFNRATEGTINALLEHSIDNLDISVSGFTQETYARAHRGGNIDKVKKNMLLFRERMGQCGNPNINVTVIYHMYADNLGADFDLMKQFCADIGFTFFPTWARSINLELSLLHLREIGKSRYNPGTFMPRTWFDELPAVPDIFNERLEKSVYRPEDYIEGCWQDVHLNKCPDKGMPINIRWNGKTNLCSWAFDDRLHLGDFLGSDPQTRFDVRRDHPLCRECCANNFPFYCQYADIPELNSVARVRLPEDVPPDRLLLL